MSPPSEPRPASMLHNARLLTIAAAAWLACTMPPQSAAAATGMRLAQAPAPAPTEERLTSAQKKAVTYARKLLGHARTHLSTGAWQRARGSCWEAVEQLEQAFGPDHPRLLEPLREITRISLIQGKRMKEGIVAIERMIAIYERNPDSRPEDHIAALTDLADFHLMDGNREQAAAAYRHAWQAVESREGAAAADTYFARPHRLRLGAPPGRTDIVDRRPVLSFTVTAIGKLDDIEIVDTDGAGGLANSIRKALRSALFRPRIAGGEMQETPNVRLALRYPGDGRPPTLEIGEAPAE